MIVSSWQRRIHRAQELVSQYPFTSELLGFYIYIAGFHEKLHQEFSGSWEKATRSSAEKLADREPGEMKSRFGDFLVLVEKHGTTQLIEFSRQLSDAGVQSWSELLSRAWKMQSPVALEEYVALLFLQPYLEWLRQGVPAQLGSSTTTLCPFCGRKPGLGVLRPMGEGTARSLVCFLCLNEWEFRRLACPSCGEENSEKLAIYTADELNYIRLDCCDACKTYLKTVDLSKNGAASPWIDEMASAPLDLWAAERGYQKLQKNLLGM
ncbi:MAG TPA: formate dehydrogenase accessory protein FdhE [Candidatus Sulfotelmatobacter sp.]|nr:formate dehydrogenase accessory protein FdhE [Candidatus Sulfotelmatobacter sp.]